MTARRQLLGNTRDYLVAITDVAIVDCRVSGVELALNDRLLSPAFLFNLLRVFREDFGVSAR